MTSDSPVSAPDLTADVPAPQTDPGQAEARTARPGALPAAVLWDMDGTLVDTEALWVRAETELLASYGRELPADAHELLIGSGLWDAAAYLQGLGVDLHPDEIVARLARTVGDGIRAGESIWRPGARELLADLGRAGVPCALVTMSVRSLAELVLASLPAGTFQLIVPGDEVEHEKPHPAPYLQGAALLGVPIADCVALEDSPTGLRSAAASGAVTLGIPNMVDLSAAPAHQILPTLAGIGSAELGELFTAHHGSQPTEGPHTR